MSWSLCEFVIHALMAKIQVNIWKIAYLNCGRRYQGITDHHSYTQLNWAHYENNFAVPLGEENKKQKKRPSPCSNYTDNLWISAQFSSVFTINVQKTLTKSFRENLAFKRHCSDCFIGSFKCRSTCIYQQNYSDFRVIEWDRITETSLCMFLKVSIVLIFGCRFVPRASHQSMKSNNARPYGIAI